MAAVNSRFSTQFPGNIIARGPKVLLFGDPYNASPTYQTLTASYVSGNATNNILDLDQAAGVVLDVDYVHASATDSRIKMEWSDDNSFYFQEDMEDSATNGVLLRTPTYHKLAATAKQCFQVPKLHRYLKITAIRTAGSATTTIAIGAVAVV